MRRQDLEHLIRAAGKIAHANELIIIGSQAVLGQYPDAPHALCRSMEADLWPRDAPDKADLIDAAIGEGSQFHELYGYYAQGVGPETARLPQGWQQRLVPVCSANTDGKTGWCLEVHDLALAKYAAGREKDLEFTREMIGAHMLDCNVLFARLPTMDVDPVLHDIMEARIRRQFASPGKAL